MQRARGIVTSFLCLCVQVLISGSDVPLVNSTLLRAFTCRTERGLSFHYEDYRSHTCARCYLYMPPWAFDATVTKFRYNAHRGVLKDPRTNVSHLADPDNSSSPLLQSFASELFVHKWAACCKAAWDCCDVMLREPLLAEDALYCPRTWDGWQCWPDTPAGTAANAPCPDHMYFKSEPPACTKYAVKDCWINGTWYVNEKNNEWTNYGNCGRVDEHRRFLYFHIATYSVSIAFLVPALIIFMMYKQLQVHRITMHRHLFASLFLNGIFVILFKAIVIVDELESSNNYKTIMEQNGPGCKVLFILTKYFRMTNYMWMFCEGFYLHKLIAAAFAEQKNLIMFYVIGWVFPIIPVGIYAILRQALADERCWAFPAEIYEWIMNAPNLLSLVINLAFLCNIIRVLVTKLRATHANEPSQYRKAVRATLVLVPLFGLHFCLVIYRPQSGECGALEAYTFFSHAMDGLQGFLVSLIFCYLNGEVIYLLRRSYQRYRLHHDVRGPGQASLILTRMSTTQVSTVNESQGGANNFHYRASAREGASGNKENAAEDNSDSGQEIG